MTSDDDLRTKLYNTLHSQEVAAKRQAEAWEAMKNYWKEKERREHQKDLQKKPWFNG